MPVNTRRRRDILAAAVVNKKATENLEMDGAAVVLDSKFPPENFECDVEGKGKKGNENDNDNDDTVVDKKDNTTKFDYNGKSYQTYQDMVAAKRRRNYEHLKKSGLLHAVKEFRHEERSSSSPKKLAGLASRTRKRARSVAAGPTRKSNRIRGVRADGKSVENESGGVFTIRSSDLDGSSATMTTTIGEGDFVEKEQYFNDRVNDGSDLTVKQAVELCGSKWTDEDGHTVRAAEKFLLRDLKHLVSSCSAPVVEKNVGISFSPVESNAAGGASVITPSPRPNKTRVGTVVDAEVSEDIKAEADYGAEAASARSKNKSLAEQIDDLRIDDEDCVSKVTPDRIYSIQCHPSPCSLMVAAGDKSGYLGVWNVDGYRCPLSSDEDDKDDYVDDKDGVHLFKPHNGPITHLEWNGNGTSLFSTSYDGSIRQFDLHKQLFTEVFATYDDSDMYKGKLGYGLDTGRRGFWVQGGCLDTRNGGNNDDCLFLSTSAGTVIHVDLRASGKVTMNVTLSEKKINTLSLHPNGTTLATAGLDCTVKLWDIRKLSSDTSKTTKPLVTQRCSKSINSAFFSPSGKQLLSTTMANTLDITEDAHVFPGGVVVKPSHRIKHDNITGRWLSTFMARWHPKAINVNSSSSRVTELFVVGSMSKPRRMEIWNGTSGTLLRGVQGEAMTSVSSRCCFHPSTTELIVCGGNSSGRVTVCREKGS